MRKLAAAVAFLLAGCTAPPAEPGSGIWGTAMLGPTCPVEQEPPDPACADRPYQGALEAVDASGRAGHTSGHTFFTDEQGRFNVTVEPGRYTLRNPESSNPLPRCASEGEVVVVSGAFTRADVRCDTGIR